MNRRSFMQAILASATAPYVVTTAGLLMPVRKVLSAEQFLWAARSSAGIFRWVPIGLVSSYKARGFTEVKIVGYEPRQSNLDLSMTLMMVEQ